MLEVGAARWQHHPDAAAADGAADDGDTGGEDGEDGEAPAAGEGEDRAPVPSLTARELVAQERATREDPAAAAGKGRPDWIAEAQASAAAAEDGRARTGAGQVTVPDWLRPWLTPGRVEARRLAAAGLVLATVLLLADYRVSENLLQPGLAGNKVVAAMRSAGDQAGPVLGLPALKPQVTWNSASTYLAAQSRRRVLNAYNQTPVRWLDERMERLEPLNRGVADPVALEVLRTTGTRQVLVVDEARVFASGEWEQTVRGLVRSGRFRLVERDGPLALLEVVGGQSPTRGSEQPGPGSDPTREV
jgi:hypothetical protein